MSSFTQPTEQIDQVLHSKRLALFTSVRQDGRPHSVTVWYVWHESTLLVFTQPQTQKRRNVEQNTFVTLAFDDSQRGGDYLFVEGKAVIEERAALDLAQADPSVKAAFHEKYAQELAHFGWSYEDFAAIYSTILRVHPERYRLADII